MVRTAEPREVAASLNCWQGTVDPQPVGGGITNANFRVDDAGSSFFVRIGEDLPHHGVMRFNEAAASRAAAAAGLAPEVVHEAPGALVLRFIDGRPLEARDLRTQATLERALALVRRAHLELPLHLRGPTLAFWVFHVIRDYAHRLGADGSRLASEAQRFSAAADALERAVGPTPIVFGHNDLLAANFLDDGDRLWLIDWEYGGWGSPLFDLGGLASNNGLDAAQEDWLLEAYFGRVDPTLRVSYAAMRCASLLREALWSAISEVHSPLDFDYPAYTADALARFDAAFAAFQRT